MFDRNWSGNLAALTLLVAAIWLSLWGAFEFRWSKLESDKAYSEYKRDTYSEQKEAAEQIASKCAYPTAPIDIVRECLLEQIEAYQDEDTTDQDLKAQQDMAFWAKWMVYLGVVGIPLSILGLIALLASLAQTREAISLDREIGHAQARAYVHLEDVQWTWHESINSPKPHVRLTPVWGNGGSSPTRNLKIYSEFWLRDDVLPEDFDFPVPDSTVFTPLIIAPSKTVTGEVYQVSGEKMNGIRDIGRYLFVWGVATYSDVFYPNSTQHVTKFCWYLDQYAITGDFTKRAGDAGNVCRLSWRIYQRHNCADDECGA